MSLRPSVVLINSYAGVLAMVQYVLLHLALMLIYKSTRVLDMVHLALTSHAIYFYLVINYVNPAMLLEVVWSIKVWFLNLYPLCYLILVSATNSH